MPIEATVVTPVTLPAHCGVLQLYDPVHFADAFAIQLPPGASRDPELLARFIVSNQPSWIGRLTAVRDLVVACFGLKTTSGMAASKGGGQAERVGFFQVYSRNANEIVVGEDDRHLDFRLSILCGGETEEKAGCRLTVTTVVHCHNLLGRAYIALIAPFHRAVVKASLRRAASLGWPREGSQPGPAV